MADERLHGPYLVPFTELQKHLEIRNTDVSLGHVIDAISHSALSAQIDPVHAQVIRIELDAIEDKIDTIRSYFGISFEPQNSNSITDTDSDRE